MTKAVQGELVVPGSPVAKTRLFFRLHWQRGGPGQPTPAWVLRFAYTMWLVALAFKLLGSSWDVSWHFKFIRDDFAPPHLINTVGTGIVIVLVAIHSFTGLGCDRRSLRLMQTGLGLFLIAAPLDVLNHRVNGLDLTAWSPTHLLLYFGTAVMLAGVIDGWRKFAEPGRVRTLVLAGLWAFFLENMFFPNGQQEYGVLGLRAWDRGAPEAEPSLLSFAAQQIGHPVDRAAVLHFTMPIADWVYPLWGIGMSALVLLLARHTIGRGWAATAVAGAYVAYRMVIRPLLVAGTFPASTIPFYLVFVGLAADLGYRRGALTGVLVAAFGYGVLWLQSLFGAAPPIAYWTLPVVLVAVTAVWWVTATRLRVRASSLPT
ncbi:hypothetical protein LWP59_39280 [Amycolatopsis acidiphila]|uniref:Uncharacterized protein n=1 Tax=Amycolatopsis acidiphila TaxID=715473 RepID=A0A558AGT9_9PSEU|nr:hypothetical protein [Amycolatopsis acidiphila]TVT23495.1 hypothetical protein FNH06_09910 [Amycolatopsis acidiphila]UIJ59954.1 hypothetical protein LWP59_39280 [Amycolatopsis acidiphila]GHG62225.1 hypothetical protein GCM10017788_17630 [Amycolatopsis acidiphila]